MLPARMIRKGEGTWGAARDMLQGGNGGHGNAQDAHGGCFCASCVSSRLSVPRKRNLASLMPRLAPSERRRRDPRKQNICGVAQIARMVERKQTKPKSSLHYSITPVFPHYSITLHFLSSVSRPGVYKPSPKFAVIRLPVWRLFLRNQPQ